jgi:hypothetical protein
MERPGSMQRGVPKSRRLAWPPHLRLASRGRDKTYPSSPQTRKRKASATDLSFRVDIWDETWSKVEETVAMTSNGTIGYAAYWESTRQFPGRNIALSYKGQILSRSGNRGG